MVNIRPIINKLNKLRNDETFFLTRINKFKARLIKIKKQIKETEKRLKRY